MIFNYQKQYYSVAEVKNIVERFCKENKINLTKIFRGSNTKFDVYR